MDKDNMELLEDEFYDPSVVILGLVFTDPRDGEVREYDSEGEDPFTMSEVASLISSNWLEHYFLSEIIWG